MFESTRNIYLDQIDATRDDIHGENKKFKQGQMILHQTPGFWEVFIMDLNLEMYLSQ